VQATHAREPEKCNESIRADSAAFPHAPRRYFSASFGF